VPIALVVVPVVDAPAAVLVADDPPAPSVALNDAPELPPLETPAPLPAEPPLSADALAAPVEVLSPEFSFGVAAGAAPVAAVAVVWPPFAPCTSVPA
jgi:hypothetical protein